MLTPPLLTFFSQTHSTKYIILTTPLRALLPPINSDICIAKANSHFSVVNLVTLAAEFDGTNHSIPPDSIPSFRFPDVTLSRSSSCSTGFSLLNAFAGSSLAQSLIFGIFRVLFASLSTLSPGNPTHFCGFKIIYTNDSKFIILPQTSSPKSRLKHPTLKLTYLFGCPIVISYSHVTNGALEVPCLLQFFTPQNLSNLS